MNLLLSCVAGCVAGIATVLVTGPVLAGVEPFWIAEGLTALAAGVAWMTAGLRVAKTDQTMVGPILFCLGAGAAWLLTRGIVHGTSAYYGLFPFGLACLGAGCAWLLQRRHNASKRGRTLAVVLPLTVLVIVFSNALLRAPLGVTRRVITADSTTRVLPVVAMEADISDGWYVWSQNNVELVESADSTVYIELDPGSGRGRLRIAETREAQQVRFACAAFHAQVAALVQSEIRNGSIPSFITALPVRHPTCKTGRVWVARG